MSSSYMDIISLIFFFVIIVPSAIIHEYAHGWMADRLGDSTARDMGRLTLNPIAHIDPWGTVLMPILLGVLSGGTFLFAYAKPVPYNPNNMKDPKKDPALVALAGPASNLIIAIVIGMIIRFIPTGDFSMLLAIIVYANILLAVFNMVPIPPLDGSKVLFWLLPDSAWKVRQTLEQYGFVLLLFFIFFAFEVIVPIISFLFTLIVGTGLRF